MSTIDQPITERELSFKRVFNAPRELVFKVWTEPEHVVVWWGPTGFTNTIHNMEVKPGGEWNFIMHGPDGTDYPNRIIYRKVVKPELLEFWHGSDNENDPGSFDVTVNFAEVAGNKTEITMRMVFKSKELRDMIVEKAGAIEGNKQTMDKLEAYLANMH